MAALSASLADTFALSCQISDPRQTPLALASAFELDSNRSAGTPRWLAALHFLHRFLPSAVVVMQSFDGNGTFAVGQRLRPATHTANGGASRPISHKKRTHVIYGSDKTRGARATLIQMCTRNRLILSVVVVCFLFLAFTHRRVPGPVVAEDLPVTPIHRIKTDINKAALAAGNTLLEYPVNPAEAQKAQLAAVQKALEEHTEANVNLKIELANAQERVRAAEEKAASVDAKIAAAEAKAAAAEKAAADAAAAAAQSTSVAPVAHSASRALTTSVPIEVPSYPPIAIAASKQFSRFFCIGGRGRLKAQNDRSCRFQNICYRPSTNKWLFYQNPEEKLVVLLDEGEIISEFPEQFLNARSMGNPQDAQWWSPSIVKEADGIPSSAFAARVDPSKPNVNVLYHPHYPSNMGHVIGDDLFPIFNLMSSFGMLVSDAQFIITRDCEKIFPKSAKKAKQCDFFLNMLLPGVTDKKYLAATQKDFVEKVRGSESSGDSDLVCFEQLLVGNGPWGFQQSLGKAPSWWAYHAFYLNNLGINPQRTPKKHRITVSIKKGKRALANNDELVAYLKEKFPTYEVDALELTSLGGWKNELNYLLDTSVLITPCGGVSMSAMFMPHNSALVIVDYFNLKKNVSFGMEERLWANLGYVRPFHYPFTRDEVRMPEGHDPNDYQEMRDWGEVRVNLERMETIVKAAISHVDNFMVFGQE